MTINDKLKTYLADLIDHKDGLYYKDQYEKNVGVKIQSMKKIEDVNGNPSTVNKLSKNGVSGCWVIGNDEFGQPLIISTESLKTYILESDELEKDEYLNNEVVVVYDNSVV